MKRIFALLLAVLCCTGVLSGCGGNPEKGISYITPDLGGAKLKLYMAKTTELELEGSYVDTTVEQYLNMDLEYVEVDSVSATVKELDAQGNAPDLIWISGYTHTGWGVFGEEEYECVINIYDVLDEMPNLKAFLNDPANKELVKKFTYAEGKMYAVRSEERV